MTTPITLRLVRHLFGTGDCYDVLLEGNTDSGLYILHIGRDVQQGTASYCDMTTDGGGWLVWFEFSISNACLSASLLSEYIRSYTSF